MPYKSSDRSKRSVGKSVEVSRNQDLRTLSGLSYPNRWAPADVDATGGTISDPGNGYRYHTFKTSGSLVVSEIPGGHPGTCEVLVVAGGGGSGAGYYAGGGAGGVAKATFPLSVTTYPIAIGAASGVIANGNDTTVSSHPIGTITCKGGGRGSLFGSHGGGAGGSGGGTGNQYGTKGAPGFSGRDSQPGAVGLAYTGNAMPFSPITPAPYDPSAPGVSVQTNPYGSDAPVGSPGEEWPTGKFNQGEFPSTYYMGLQGYGNRGGMAYGPSLDGGGAGGGGAGGAGEDR